MARRIRRGSQRPTFTTVREWSYTDGDYAAKMFGSYGVRFYESQEFELRAFLARNDDGTYSATTICISKPRQNGKSFAARFYAIWMAAIEGKHVLFSAHHGGTVRKMFKEIRDFILAHSDFAMMLKPNRQGIYAAKGSEGIYFVDDEGHEAGLIEFQTRTTSGGRGETYHVIIVDEAQELTDDQLDAIKPTTFAASSVEDGGSDPQMIYLGTPPNEKCPGTVFRDYHDRAHADPSTSIWWMEWAAVEVPDMTDKAVVMELVYMTNPAMGYRIKETTMYDAMDTMRPDGFARECLGWWSPIAVNVAHPIAKSDWDECAMEGYDMPDDGRLVYAVRFSPDGIGVIAVCQIPDEGLPYVEVIARWSVSVGTSRFCDQLMKLYGYAEMIVVDGKGIAQTLNDKLVDAGVDEDDIVRPSVNDAIAAYAGFADAVKEHSLLQSGQEGLRDAAVGCVKRRIGNAGGFGFESSGNCDATLVDACALAYHYALQLRREPAEELEVW